MEAVRAAVIIAATAMLALMAFAIANAVTDGQAAESLRQAINMAS